MAAAPMITIPNEFKELHNQMSQQPNQQQWGNKSVSALNSSQICRNDPLTGKLIKIDLIDDIEELRQ